MIEAYKAGKKFMLCLAGLFLLFFIGTFFSKEDEHIVRYLYNAVFFVMSLIGAYICDQIAKNELHKDEKN